MTRKPAILAISVVAVCAGFLLALAHAQSPLYLPTVTYLTGEKLASNVAVGDLNGDGIPDLVAVHWSGFVSTLLGNGDGTFRSGSIIKYKAKYAVAVAMADLNHDGKLDLVVGIDYCKKNKPPGCLSVLLGRGDGTFKHATVYDTGGYGAVVEAGTATPSIIVADINGDGNPDLVVLNQNDGTNSNGVIGVLIGNGNGTFKPVVTYDTGGYPANSMAMADLNGDGKLDLAVVNCAPTGSTNCPGTGNMTVAVRLGKGDGTFGIDPKLWHGWRGQHFSHAGYGRRCER